MKVFKLVVLVSSLLCAGSSAAKADDQSDADGARILCISAQETAEYYLNYSISVYDSRWSDYWAAYNRLGQVAGMMVGNDFADTAYALGQAKANLDSLYYTGPPPTPDGAYQDLYANSNNSSAGEQFTEGDDQLATGDAAYDDGAYLAAYGAYMLARDYYIGAKSKAQSAVTGDSPLNLAAAYIHDAQVILSRYPQP